MATRGRPPKPLDADSSSAAYLGAELRSRRQARGWTLKQLAEQIGYSMQHVSEVERSRSAPSGPFVAACDRALGARGRLLDLLPAVVNERIAQRQERETARRAAVRCDASEAVGDEDVEPTNRRGLLGAGAAAALAAAGVAAAPAAAREVDPELPAHWTRLLDVLSRHDDAFGPHDVLAVVRHQLTLIAAHRQVARDALRTQLLRVESRWAEFAAFLSNDVGQTRRRDVYTDRALQLAREADDRDGTALALMRQGQWAVQELDAQRAVAFTQAALQVPGTSAQVRARCALRAANSHALAGDEPACQRRLDDAYELAEPSGTPGAVTRVAVRATEARSWLWMQPRRAIGLYEDALREWPRGQVRDGGVQQARLALACAAAGERGRAEAEGRKALAIARTTRSSVAARELKQLGEALAAR
jgi:transcriptional regulator with XRE-family HTH domain